MNFISKGTKNFIEIGPGKVLSGLIKRINKNVNIKSINNEEDIKEIKAMFNLKNKKVIVTGATGGIGNSIIKSFIQNEARVLATGTNEEKLKSLKAPMTMFDKKFDISKHYEIENFIEEVIDILNGNPDVY